MSVETVAAIVLAGGKGTRMNSPLPKVLHEIHGKAMLQHVTDTLRIAGISEILVVLGGDLAPFHDFLSAHPQIFATEQKAREGTADAVASAAWAFVEPSAAPSYARFERIRGMAGGLMGAPGILICMGDTPAVSAGTLERFISESLERDVSVLAMRHPEPYGYGRMVEDRKGLRIVEEKNATDAERSIDIVNTGIYFAKTNVLFSLLAKVKPNPVTREYYLTDVLSIAAEQGLRVGWSLADDYREFSGVNNQQQLEELKAFMNR